MRAERRGSGSGELDARFLEKDRKKGPEGMDGNGKQGRRQSSLGLYKPVK